jgi:galactokinase
MTTLGERLLQGFAQAFGGAPALVVRAPGRVNLIGEHTDYNDGFAMPIAIGQETRVGFRPGGKALRVAALDFGESDSFDPARPEHCGGGWRDYVRGVVDQLRQAGVAVPGGDLAIAGSIAKGTGLSSSASLEVAVARVILESLGQDWDAVRLALLAQRAESDFVGVRCGNLDQIASAATTLGHALLIDCRSLALRQIALPDDAVVMIVQSGVVRGLVDGEYNRRRAECEAAAKVLGVAALRDADEAMLEAARGGMDDSTYRRARHVVTENRRTMEAAEALGSGDLVRMGVLMRESHVSQGADFGITVPPTDALAATMNEAIGREGGARQTGGGFGGAVVGLMRKDRVGAVRDAVLQGYRTPAGDAPVICVETPSAGAGPVD